MSNTLPDIYRNILARVFVIVLGGASVAWGVTTMPTYWQQSSLEHIAHHIIEGEPYKAEVFSQRMPAIEAAESSARCRPIALWSAAIIRLRMVEQAIGDKQGRPGETELLKMLGHSIRHALACSPAQPFLWLILNWVEDQGSGFTKSDSNYLRMSYRLGPNEGWIAMKRNPIAFREYENLPDDLKARAVDELVALVNSGFYRPAMDILTGPAWHLRNSILPRIATLPRQRRETFTKMLYDRGVDLRAQK